MLLVVFCLVYYMIFGYIEKYKFLSMFLECIVKLKFKKFLVDVSG